MSSSQERLIILNSYSKVDLKKEFLKLCSCETWAERVAQSHPFPDLVTLQETLDTTWKACTEIEWKEMFQGHPRIGDKEALRAKYHSNNSQKNKKDEGWEAEEQAGAKDADEKVLDALHEWNQKYEDKFGFIFLVCATGKSAEEMLSLLQDRMKNDPIEELQIAAYEQAKITQLRAIKLLQSLSLSSNTSNNSNSSSKL